MGYYTDFYLQAAPVTEDQFHSIDSALQELRSMREAYEYTDVEVTAIFEEIGRQTQILKDRFAGKKAFTLEHKD